MKIKIRQILLLAIFCSFGVYLNAQAQIDPLNNLGIFPPTQAGFDPFGKFTSIGESGGTPGPTFTGCDLYGFRAQLGFGKSVALGVEINSVTGESSSVLNFSGNGYRIQDSSPFFSTSPNPFNGACGLRLGQWRREFFGNNVLRVFGTATVNGVLIPSDITLKKDVQIIDNALDKVMRLNGVSYDYRADERPELNLPTERQIGFIVQEVEKVLPELVQKAVDPDSREEADYSVMNYIPIIALLTEATKDQQEIIEVQNDKIDEQIDAINELEERIARLEKLIEGNGAADARAESLPSTSKVATLSQNRPNPASNFTTVDFQISEQLNNPSLKVFNNDGKALKSFDLTQNQGSINIDTSDLPVGIYYYSIVDNDRVLAKEKLVIAR